MPSKRVRFGGIIAVVAAATWFTVSTIGVRNALDGLSSNNADVRNAAISSLATSSNPLATRGLIRVVRSEQPHSRAWLSAVSALAQVGPRAIRPVVRAQNPGMGGILIRAASGKSYSDLWSLRDAGDEIVATVGAAAAAPLMKLLRDSDADIRRDAVRLLRHLDGRPVVEAVIGMVADEDGDVRDEALYSVVAMGDVRALDTLAGLLSESPGGVTRAKAAEGLGNIDDPRATPYLVEALGDELMPVREAAARALGVQGNPASLEGLLATIEVEAAGLQRAVVAALASFKDKRAVDALLGALGNPDAGVRHLAIEALGTIGDSQAVEPLMEILLSEPGRARSKAACALSRIGDLRAVDGLLDVLDDKSPFFPEGTGAFKPIRDITPAVRAHIALALAAFREPRVTKRLILLLEDGSFPTREAVLALGRNGTDEAVAAIQDFLNVDLAEVAAEYKEHIERGDQQTIPALMAALETYGNLEMAQDLYWCSPVFSLDQLTWGPEQAFGYYARHWAEHHGLEDEVERSRDNPDRPKWGCGE